MKWPSVSHVANGLTKISTPTGCHALLTNYHGVNVPFANCAEHRDSAAIPHIDSADSPEVDDKTVNSVNVVVGEVGNPWGRVTVKLESWGERMGSLPSPAPVAWYVPCLLPIRVGYCSGE